MYFGNARTILVIGRVIIKHALEETRSDRTMTDGRATTRSERRTKVRPTSGDARKDAHVHEENGDTAPKTEKNKESRREEGGDGERKERVSTVRCITLLAIAIELRRLAMTRDRERPSALLTQFRFTIERDKRDSETG